MEEISVIGIDLAKRVFQLCAVTGAGAIVWEKRLRRAALIKFLEDEAPRCLIGMEACGSAHHWARWLVARGFRVKLMAPRAVKAYRAGVHKAISATPARWQRRPAAATSQRCASRARPRKPRRR